MLLEESNIVEREIANNKPQTSDRSIQTTNKQAIDRSTAVLPIFFIGDDSILDSSTTMN